MVSEDHARLRAARAIGFNWNECQTTFMPGPRGDVVGRHRLLRRRWWTRRSRSRRQGRLRAGAGGAEGATTPPTFVDGIGIPVGAKNKKGAWLYLPMVDEQDHAPRTGCARAPARRRAPAPYADRGRASRRSQFPKEWFDTTLDKPEDRPQRPAGIVPVTEFRDTIGVALTNIVGGADPAAELKKATEAFRPVLEKANESQPRNPDALLRERASGRVHPVVNAEALDRLRECRLFERLVEYRAARRT